MVPIYNQIRTYTKEMRITDPFHFEIKSIHVYGQKFNIIRLFQICNNPFVTDGAIALLKTYEASTKSALKTINLQVCISVKEIKKRQDVLYCL